MDSFEIAKEHKPDQPLADGLPLYQNVLYDNIDTEKWYYMSYDQVDYIVQVVGKDDYLLLMDWYMSRPRDNPQAQWQDIFAPQTAEKDMVVNGRVKFYNYVGQEQNNNVVMNGGGLIEDINSRLDDRSYILPAGTVAHRAVPMMRTTPPFFPRKSLRQGRKNRRRASPSSVSRLRRSTRRAKKQKRLTRRRR